jgi:hypothetical protein
LPLNLSVSDDRKFLYNWHPPLAAKKMAEMYMFAILQFEGISLGSLDRVLLGQRQVAG